MKIGDTTYERLPGRARRRFGLFDNNAYRLLLSMPHQEEGSAGATRHLLHVKRARYEESYRRFDLKDIQALVRTRTRAGMVLNILLALAGAFSLLAGAPGGTIGLAVGGMFATVFLVGLGINAAFGPTCVCQVRTAVCAEDLPSLGRLRTADYVFHVLKLQIDEAQGGSVTEEDVSEGGAAFVRAPLADQRQNDGRSGGGAGSEGEGAPARLSFHVALFALLLIDAPMAAFSIMNPEGLPEAAFGVWVIFTAIAAIGALIQQHGKRAPSGLKGLTWAALGYLAVCVGFSVVLAPFLMTMEGLSAEQDPMGAGPSFVDAFNYFSIVFDLLVGLTGFLLIRDSRRGASGAPLEHRSTAYRPRGTDES